MSFQVQGELIVKKNILIGLAILALSAPAAFAAKHHAMKPKADAPAASSGPMMGGVTAADKAMYKKNMHDSGMK